MGLYDIENRYADLQDKYGQNQAINQYANFVGQQRFKRQREDMNTGFQRSFPKFTGSWAKRLGSNVRSGVFREKLGQNVGDFGRALGRVETDQMNDQGQFEANKAREFDAYQKALLRTQEEMARQRAAMSSYQGMA
jgi:hypothetical protein